MSDPTWVCPTCATPNDGRFCIRCGRPEAAAGDQRPTTGRSTLAWATPAGSAASVSAAPAGPPTFAPLPPVSGPAPGAAPADHSARVAGPSSPWNSSGGASSVPMADGSSVALFADESIVGEWYFTPRQILAHLKTHVVLTDQRVLVSDPNTILGIIPLGYHTSSAPHAAVDQVDHGTRVISTRLLLGVGAVLTLLYNIVDGTYAYGGLAELIWVLMLLGVAAYCFITARVVGIFLHASGASTIGARARGSELPSVEAAAFQINQRVTQARRFPPATH